MDTPLDPKQTEPRHTLIARADDELAHAYQQITSAGEQIARAEEQLSRLERAARAVPGKRRPLGGPAVRGFIGVILAACIGVAAVAWQSPYGDPARDVITRWAPQLALASTLLPEKPAPPAQPSPPAVQAAAAQAAPLQPAPLAQSAPEHVAPAVAALSPELTQLLQSMARDLANLGQSIEQLKASQQQMARDHVNAVDLLRVSQEQMARAIAKTSEAKTSEQNLRPKISAPAPRPIAAPPRKPVPTL
jgi:septal ring factor EnvC (AmiA/AmiB activator)